MLHPLAARALVPNALSAAAGLAVRALDPPYPVLGDQSWTKLPDIVFVVADFFSTACLYCLALLFSRFLVVTTASPGERCRRHFLFRSSLSVIDVFAGSDGWCSQEMCCRDAVFSVAMAGVWVSCL